MTGNDPTRCDVGGLGLLLRQEEQLALAVFWILSWSPALSTSLL